MQDWIFYVDHQPRVGQYCFLPSSGLPSSSIQSSAIRSMTNQMPIITRVHLRSSLDRSLVTLKYILMPPSVLSIYDDSNNKCNNFPTLYYVYIKKNYVYVDMYSLNGKFKQECEYKCFVITSQLFNPLNPSRKVAKPVTISESSNRYSSKGSEGSSVGTKCATS